MIKCPSIIYGKESYARIVFPFSKLDYRPLTYKCAGVPFNIQISGPLPCLCMIMEGEPGVYTFN